MVRGGAGGTCMHRLKHTLYVILKELIKILKNFQLLQLYVTVAFPGFGDVKANESDLLLQESHLVE